MSDQYLSAPRELLETVEHFLATGDRENSLTLGRLRALLAAPAEDVRAVVEEPVSYAWIRDLEKVSRRNVIFEMINKC